MDRLQNVEFHIVNNLNKLDNSKSNSNFNVLMNTNKFMSTQNINKLYQMTVSDVSFFNSIYNINSTNNQFILTETNITLVITTNTVYVVPVGVYTITTLLSYLSNQINTVAPSPAVIAGCNYVFSTVNNNWYTNIELNVFGLFNWTFNITPLNTQQRYMDNLLGYYTNFIADGTNNLLSDKMFNIFNNLNCIYIQSSASAFNTQVDANILDYNPLANCIYVVPITVNSGEFAHKLSYDWNWFTCMPQPWRKQINYRITDRLGNDVEGLEEFNFTILFKQLPADNIVPQ